MKRDSRSCASELSTHKGKEKMIQMGPAKNLTDAVCQGMHDARSRSLRGSMPGTEEFFCKWVAAHVRDFVGQKLTPLMMRFGREPEVRSELRSFANELGMGRWLEAAEEPSPFPEGDNK